MLGLPLCGAPLDRVHLTRSGDGGGRATPGRVVHVGALPPTEVGRVSGTLVTSPVRTLIDVACSSSFLTTVVAADAALRRQLVSPVELSTALDQTRRRRGAAAARRALRFADGRSESVGESYTRVAMHQARSPTPELQISIFGPGGTFIARTDLGYPAWGVLIEFDGAIKYSKLLAPGQRAEDVVLAEKRREDRLRDLGYVVVRLAWNELADPAAIADRITAALDRGRRVVDGAGLTGSWSAAPAIGIAG